MKFMMRFPAKRGLSPLQSTHSSSEALPSLLHNGCLDARGKTGLYLQPPDFVHWGNLTAGICLLGLRDIIKTIGSYCQDCQSSGLLHISLLYHHTQLQLNDRIYLLYYTIPSTQHKSQSYRYMFRLNKSSSGVSKNQN